VIKTKRGGEKGKDKKIVQNERERGEEEAKRMKEGKGGRNSEKRRRTGDSRRK
jgi:hypothetical protein